MKRLTKDELLSLVDRLKDVHYGIENNHYEYVCNAIGTKDDWQTTYLRLWVSNMLGGRSTLLAWLLDTNRLNSPLEYSDNELKSHTKELRLKWIYWMISELEYDILWS
jgi:hypothetical protein